MLRQPGGNVIAMNTDEQTTTMKMDEIELSMLEILQDVGCISVSDLAERVGLSPMMCSHRLRRLVDEDIVTMYHAARNPKALGLELVCQLLVPTLRLERPTQKSRLSLVAALG